MPKNNQGLQQKWEEAGLNHQEVEQWIKVGLRLKEYEFAAYLKQKGYTFQSVNLSKLRNQYFLDKKYPLEERQKIIKLDASYKNLTGFLSLVSFSKLEYLNCRNNQLTQLSLNKCLQLTEIDCWNNQLSQDLTCFAHLTNLEELNIFNNHFFGSLEPLQNLKKLKWLDVRSTKVDAGLEYLPKSLKWFSCNNTSLVKILECYGKANGNNYLPLLQVWWSDQLLVQEKEVNQTVQNGEDTKENNQSLIQEIKNDDDKINLKKQLKKKVSLPFEKDLKKKLIDTCSEYIKVKKENLSSVKYEENEIKKELIYAPQVLPSKQVWLAINKQGQTLESRGEVEYISQEKKIIFLLKVRKIY